MDALCSAEVLIWTGAHANTSWKTDLGIAISMAGCRSDEAEQARTSVDGIIVGSYKYACNASGHLQMGRTFSDVAV